MDLDWGDTVDDDERLAVTTEADVIVEPTHRTGVLADLQAGDLALEGGGQVGLLGGGDVLGLDVGDGGGQGRFLLRTVTDDHRLFQFGGFLLQGDVQGRGVGHHAEGFVADG